MIIKARMPTNPPTGRQGLGLTEIHSPTSMKGDFFPNPCKN